MKPAADLRRKKELAKIHLAKKALGLDDDTYRSMLKRVSGRESAGDLDQAGRTKVLEHLKASGFVDQKRGSPAAGGGAGRPSSAGQPSGLAAGRKHAEGAEAAKMRALWLALYQLGEVQDSSEASLARYAQRMTGKEALQWLDQRDVAKVINTLRAWAERVGLRAPDAILINRIDDVRRNHQMDAGSSGFAAKVILLDELYRRARARGSDALKASVDVDVWLRTLGLPKSWLLSHEQADQMIDQIGRYVRAALP